MRSEELIGLRTMLDPVTVKILWDRLVSIVDEATVAQYRTAFSTVVQEANDFACSIMDTTGGTLANSQTGLPSFVATQAFTLSDLLQRFPREDFHPGDVFITNDPWIGTGQAMDITLLSPIFRGERLVAFAGSVAHAPDLGGAQHWNLSVDVFDEALLIPPMKLYDRGQPNETLLALIRANSRLPHLTLGDLDSQLAAIHRSTTRLLSVMDEYDLRRSGGARSRRSTPDRKGRCARRSPPFLMGRTSARSGARDSVTRRRRVKRVQRSRSRF